MFGQQGPGEELLNSADGDIAARLDEVYERMNTIDAHGAEAKVGLLTLSPLSHSSLAWHLQNAFLIFMPTH